MKVVALREAKGSLSAYVSRAQKERILITRHGKPAALMIGVEGYDVEELVTAADPEFWRLIEERRRERSTPLAELQARIEKTRPGRPRKRRPSGSRR